MIPERKRIEYIDAIKGFAAICVIIGHVCDGYLSSGLFENGTFLFVLFKIIYSFHMALFFVISGYLFYSAYVKTDGIVNTAKLKTQLFNIGYVYALFSIVMWIFKFIGERFVNRTVSVKDLLLIWTKAISPYWYLYVLFFCYLLAALFIKIKINPYLLLGIGLAFNIFSNFLSSLGTVSEIPKILYYFIFFLIGCLWNQKNDWFAKYRKIFYCLSGVSVILMIIVWPVSERLDKVPGANFVIALGLSFLFVSLFAQIKALGNNRFLRYCGQRALEIYVIHCFFTAGFRFALLKIGISSGILSLVINTILSLALSLAFDWAVKKIKIHSLLFKPYSMLKKGSCKEK